MDSLLTCMGCNAEINALTEPVRIQTEHGDATLTAQVFLCEKCHAESILIPARAEAIIKAVLLTPAKTRDQLAIENAEFQCSDLRQALNESATVEDAQEMLADYLVLIFGDAHDAAAKVFAKHFTINILHGIEVSEVGALSPGVQSAFLRMMPN